MPATSIVHVRVDGQVKEQAAKTLSAMGMTVSDAVRVFLTKISAEKRFPFVLEEPNAVTLAAIEEADEIVRSGNFRFKNADEMFSELEKKTSRKQKS
jgi:DNA-damage-inducible protein J